MNKLVLNDRAQEVLQKARETYGHRNQIMVCMEELCELACVLAKYPRYEDEEKATEELHDKVLDEMADVMVILDHVRKIFGFTDGEINSRISSKITRVERWVSHSDSMQETIDDRKVEESKCNSCRRGLIPMSEEAYLNTCKPCHAAQVTDGIAPFYDPISDETGDCLNEV